MQANATHQHQYELRSGKAGKSHLVLKAANNRVIGVSETYTARGNE
ncbi:MAG: DUF1508 domain-containing protein [Planctomycetaceae bacterium]